jgi:hypothetical protein
MKKNATTSDTPRPAPTSAAQRDPADNPPAPPSAENLHRVRPTPRENLGTRRIEIVPIPEEFLRFLGDKIGADNLVSAEELAQLRATETRMVKLWDKLNASGHDCARAAWQADQQHFLNGEETDGPYSLEEFERDFANRRATVRHAIREAAHEIHPLIVTIAERFKKSVDELAVTIEKEERERYAAWGYADYWEPSMLHCAVLKAGETVVKSLADPDHAGKPSEKVLFLKI